MVEEMASLDKNETCDVAELSNGRNTIGSKWMFKKKLNAEGKVDKYKSWLVTKGYSGVEGIDFGEIFSPISKLISIRFIFFVVIAFDCDLK
jgi:hypothetical protein